MTLTLNVDDRQTSAKLNRAETNVKVTLKLAFNLCFGYKCDTLYLDRLTITENKMT